MTATAKALITVGTAAAGAVGGAVVDRYGARAVKGIGEGMAYVGKKIAEAGKPTERSF